MPHQLKLLKSTACYPLITHGDEVVCQLLNGLSARTRLYSFGVMPNYESLLGLDDDDSRLALQGVSVWFKSISLIVKKETRRGVDLWQ